MDSLTMSRRCRLDPVDVPLYSWYVDELETIRFLLDKHPTSISRRSTHFDVLETE
jgi:hypothetical protein